MSEYSTRQRELDAVFVLGALGTPLPLISELAATVAAATDVSLPVAAARAVLSLRASAPATAPPTEERPTAAQLLAQRKAARERDLLAAAQRVKESAGGLVRT
jgi:hypothetical protein